MRIIYQRLIIVCSTNFLLNIQENGCRDSLKMELKHTHISFYSPLKNDEKYLIAKCILFSISNQMSKKKWKIKFKGYIFVMFMMINLQSTRFVDEIELVAEMKWKSGKETTAYTSHSLCTVDIVHLKLRFLILLLFLYSFDLCSIKFIFIL